MTGTMLQFYANIEPESLLVVASLFWGAAALATGVPTHRFPDEFPLIFAAISAVAALIGVTEFVPEDIDILFTFVGVLIFTVTPLLITWKLYREYPPRNPGGHETATDGGGPDGGGEGDEDEPYSLLLAEYGYADCRRPNITRSASRSREDSENDP